MKIPEGVTIYHKGQTFKVGAECPKDLEETLTKAIESQAKTSETKKAKLKKAEKEKAAK